jgi:hydrogenase/urease accessory protein HupE
VDCGPAGLAGATLAVQGFAQPGEEVLVRIALADGRAVSTVLRAAAPALAVPARPGGAVLRSYLILGVRHILLGWDHLLFVLGLVLLVAGARRLIATLTAFTAAHSITLSLAALGVVHVPAPPVEAAIALSIVFLAAELCRGPQTSFAARRPYGVALAFGLLHGLGFAGALAEAGLPPGDIPRALFGFNLGVELGQLLFVAAVLLAGRLLRPAARPLAYGIGTLAAYWCWERVAAFWIR